MLDEFHLEPKNGLSISKCAVHPGSSGFRVEACILKYTSIKLHFVDFVGSHGKLPLMGLCQWMRSIGNGREGTSIGPLEKHPHN